MILTFGR